ncbi:MAG TPA: hypothetical protein PLH82_02430 [Candidatus Paceibacterota bacterium]|nr:hypothetical protein [Candidatus Paceibacterota bacterium]HRV32024.1 hypothetical protein [Candidatus Paceibacterota bacterium]
MPSGKSVGTKEAITKNIDEALKNIKDIEKQLIGKNIFNQNEIDNILMKNLQQ